MAGAFLDAGVFKQGGANSPYWMNNIGLAAATTTTSNDSIKITSADGTEFSSVNYGWVTIGDATSGRLKTFSITDDVTIDLTGAHWGAGTLRDITDQKLVVYALNNNGSLVWGVSLLSQNHGGIILDADDSATASSITSGEKVLVNSALSADAQATMVGWFKANFDDDGGASADIWAVQTGDRDLNIGYQDIPIMARYQTDGSLTIATGGSVRKQYDDLATDTHNSVTIGASWVFTAPVAGKYTIAAGAEYAAAAWASADLELKIAIQIDASIESDKKFISQVAATYRSSVKDVVTLSVAKGGTILCTVSQNSGVTLTESTGPDANSISIVYDGVV